MEVRVRKEVSGFEAQRNNPKRRMTFLTQTSITMKKNVNNSTVNGASAASSAQSTNSYMQYTQYRNRQAHGWAAEDANAMADRLAGKAVDQVGRNNSCNGADRIVDGVRIQTKYCATA